MYRGQRILLKPTEAQRHQFVRACNLSRFAWNWAVALCERHYEWFGKLPGYKRLGEFDLVRRWNKVKNRHFPWVLDLSVHIPQQCFRHVDQAYRKAFSRIKRGKNPGFPKFHKKGTYESFQVVRTQYTPIKRVGNRFYLPRIGLVKFHGRLRWPDGKQVRGRVKLRAGRWWLCLSYELPDPPKLPVGRPTAGVDLGCTTFATLSSGSIIVEKVSPPKPFTAAKSKIRRLHRAMARKRKGSSNSKKAAIRLGRQHERVANIRCDFLQKLTSRIIETYGVVVIENLGVNGMTRGRCSGTISDLGFFEFRRQLEYKAEVTGTEVVVADRFYPSSKTCSHCGLVKTKLELSERIWTCEWCGVTHDRDENAARNLEKLPQGMGKVTPVEARGSLTSRKAGRSAGQRSRNTKRKPPPVVSE